MRKIASAVLIAMLLGSNFAFVGVVQATVVPDYLSCPFEAGTGKTIINFNT
ncbi:MAG: hypothetical protein KAI79_07275 [Bacteroidales bacterium]|nr:hypothetical protein [Bacteroidales bacterium]